MSRKFSILVAFCVVLFGAILAGYWDMLDSEKLRSVRDQASRSVAELTGTRSDGSDARADDPVPSGGASRLAAPEGADPSKPAEPDAPAGPAASGGAGMAASGTTEGPAAAPAGEAPTREASLPQTGAPQTPAVQPSAKAPPTPPAARLPSFDVLRVEPDGSAVLAGRAAPNADVRLIDGNRTIGAARATPGGDFAIVLDDRLPAGDHQIRIEAAQGDGKRTVSDETAIVSIPKPGEPGELLAMVETPNQPSRIITLPSADPTAPATANDGSTVAAAAPPAHQAGDASGTGETASAGGRQTASAAPGTTPASPSPGSPASRPAPGAPSPFAVEAVEIENGTVYIAGRAPGNAPVRVYIDNKLIGEDRARANGRFLVTAKVPVGVGDHQIRADMIRPGGAVTSRVEVPFARPDGEAMSAAVASNDAGGSRIGAAAGTGTPAGAAGRTEAGAPTGRPAVPARPGASAPATPPSGAFAGPDIAASEPSPDAGEAASLGLGTAEGVAPPAVGDEADIATIRQPALESVRSRVLIRRGDTLWRISRQTYGVGHRYTVIYVANGDQIRNPNRIYPGQVFRLPKDEAPGGEGAPTAVQ
jgi:nucleoid-associated protein YgaU